MTDLEEFMSENEPKFKLRKFKAEITALIFEGYTYADILKFLEQKKNIKASTATLKRQLEFWQKEDAKSSSNKKSESVKSFQTSESSSSKSNPKTRDDFKNAVNRH
jgi:biopolymer transport protein ExbB/TolQ